MLPSPPLLSSAAWARTARDALRPSLKFAWRAARMGEEHRDPPKLRLPPLAAGTRAAPTTPLEPLPLAREGAPALAMISYQIS